MKRLNSKVIGCVMLPALLLLAGCASKVPEKDQYGNYFTPMKTSPGNDGVGPAGAVLAGARDGYEAV
ncbi:hypothetical protein O0544_14330 [Edwardsiella anguillarum]|nr:hypothetical protein [Edwardsiella anguillarum]